MLIPFIDSSSTKDVPDKEWIAFVLITGPDTLSANPMKVSQCTYNRAEIAKIRFLLLTRINKRNMKDNSTT